MNKIKKKQKEKNNQCIDHLITLFKSDTDTESDE